MQADRAADRATPDRAMSGRAMADRVAVVRRRLSLVVGAVGLAAYNWWVAVLLTGGLLVGHDELFSDLEARGRRDASMLSTVDLAAGALVAAALLLRGRASRRGPRPEWPWLVAFGLAGIIGAVFPYACPEGLSAPCRAAEWHLQLPWTHYVHVVAGIVEFGAATAAIVLVARRPAQGRDRDPAAATARLLAAVLAVAYPLLGMAYLTDRLGTFVEPVFFVTFSAVVAVELLEPGPLPGRQPGGGRVGGSTAQLGTPNPVARS